MKAQNEFTIFTKNTHKMNGQIWNLPISRRWNLTRPTTLSKQSNSQQRCCLRSDTASIVNTFINDPHDPVVVCRQHKLSPFVKEVALAVGKEIADKFATIHPKRNEPVARGGKAQHEWKFSLAGIDANERMAVAEW